MYVRPQNKFTTRFRNRDSTTLGKKIENLEGPLRDNIPGNNNKSSSPGVEEDPSHIMSHWPNQAPVGGQTRTRSWTPGGHNSEGMPRAPRPTFQSNNNRMRMNHNRVPEQFSTQHEELIRYFQESWNKVAKEVDNSSNKQNGHESTRNGGNTNNSAKTVEYFSERPEHPVLETDGYY